MCWAGSGDLSFATSTFLILHFIPAHTELAHVAERHRRAGWLFHSITSSAWARK